MEVTSVLRGPSLKDSDELKVVKVSSTSTTHSIAGAFAHLARAGRTVEVLAGSAATVNVAFKAVAAVRTYLLDEGLDACVVPTMKTIEGRKAVAMEFIPFKERQAEPVDSTEYICTSKTKAGALAGAIAARLRENGKVSVSVVGAAAAINAVMAIALAGKYAECKTGCFASFKKVQANDKELNVLVISVRSLIV